MSVKYDAEKVASDVCEELVRRASKKKKNETNIKFDVPLET